MSGYLEVKYPFKSNLGLNPFKSWKRQWCILRPSPTCLGAGSLAVYCSEAGAPAGMVELPSGCVVRRAKSRSRPHAFAVFNAEDPRKPRILLAAPSLNDAQVWMEKIRDLLNGTKLLGTEALLKDSYSVTIVATELSRKCDMSGDSLMTLSSTGLYVSRAQKLGTILLWKQISDVLLITETADKNRICVVTVNSEFKYGEGELKLSSPLASELVTALKGGLQEHSSARVGALSRSEGDLRSAQGTDIDTGEIRRSSWYSGPSEVSLDDIDLIMSKEAARVPLGQLSRCAAAPHLAHSTKSADDSMCDRRSLASVASGIYEEIPDLPLEITEPTESADRLESADIPDSADRPGSANRPESADLYCPMGRDVPDGPCRPFIGRAATVPNANTMSSVALEEPTYESVVECVYATMRRARRPPPLPPRLPASTSKMASTWSCRTGCAGAGAGVTRHGSLGSLPLGCGHAARAPHAANTLPKPDKARQTFSVFRKRLKSESRVASSPKADPREGRDRDVETKKKKFEFTPTRDIFKSFKVSRKMKSLKIAAGLGKGETKSCEFLDETEHVTTNRCSKSVEWLDESHMGECGAASPQAEHADLSFEFNDDAVTTLALPQEIVDLIVRGREQFKVRLKETAAESQYLPLSPAPPPDHYMVMCPRPHRA